MDVEMSASTHSVLVVLCRHANDAGECFPSTALIAKKAHLNPRTVMQAVKELEQGAWISSTQAPGKKRRFLIDGAKIQSFVTTVKTCTSAESYTPAGNCTPVKSCSTPLQEVTGVPLQETAVLPCRKLQDSPAGNCTRIEHIREQGREEGIANLASDASPSVPEFGLTAEEVTEKPTTKKKRRTEIDFYGLSENLIDDWRISRGKAKITQTVVDGFKREAEKAGIDLDEAVRVSIERGWRGFKAEWLKNTEGKPVADDSLDKYRISRTHRPADVPEEDFLKGWC